MQHTFPMGRVTGHATIPYEASKFLCKNFSSAPATSYDKFFALSQSFVMKNDPPSLLRDILLLAGTFPKREVIAMEQYWPRYQFRYTKSCRIKRQTVATKHEPADQSASDARSDD